MAKPNEKELREQWLADVRWVMSSPRGRRFVREVIARCGLYESVFRQPSPMVLPEERLVFNGARRDLGQWVHDEATRSNPAAFELMNNEAAIAKHMEREPEAEKKESEESDNG